MMNSHHSLTWVRNQNKTNSQFNQSLSNVACPADTWADLLCSCLDFVPVYALCLETYLKFSNFRYPMGVICRTSENSNLMQFEKYLISYWELHAKWFHILKINLSHSTMTCLEQLCWDALLIWQQVTNRQSVEEWEIKQREVEHAEINSVVDL